MGRVAGGAGRQSVWPLMARKRMIDPDFWSDEALGACNPLTRLLFMGLISQADDEGRLRGTPALIRSQVFPYDEDVTAAAVAAMIDTLAGFGLIVPYDVERQRYIHVVNFTKHQTINKPTPSRLPPPPETALPYDDGSTTVGLPPKRIEENRSKEKVKGREEKSTRVAREDAPDGATRPHPLMDRCVELGVVKPKLTTAPQWKQHWAAITELEHVGLTVDQLDDAIAEARQRLSRWRGGSPPTLTPSYLARHLSDFFTPPPEPIPRVTDTITNGRIRAAITTDLSDITAKHEVERAERNGLPGQVDYPRLPATTRRQ